MLQLSMVTLGVADIAAATAFYEKLGLTKSPASQDSVTFFQLAHGVLGLFGRDALIEDASASGIWNGNGGITLAFNLPSEEEVDGVIERAKQAGAEILKEPQKAFWGGYHGYFADIDGHVWEIAYNPFAPVDKDGLMKMG